MANPINPANTSKISSRVALVKLRNEERDILAECFRQFHIKVEPMDDDPVTRLSREKFEGCVLRLDDSAEAILRSARSSKSNRGILLYGISKEPKMAMKFSPFGINAVLTEPIERAAALRAVRSTYLLAIHEFRRYVRVPVAIEVVITVDGRSHSALSEEVSTGGMSLESSNLLPGKQTVEVSFQLPGAAALSIPAEICWRRETAGLLGIRFHAADSKRQVVRDWIESYVDVP